MEERSHWRQAATAMLLVLLLTCGYLLGQDIFDKARPILRRVQPQYPALAQRMSIIGSVKLEVVVQADGRVKSITAKGGHPLLVEAAQAAIRQWRWQSSSQETVETIEVRFNPQ